MLADVLVAAVAGAGDHHRAALCRHAVDGADQGQDGVRVVAVIGDHGGAAVVEDVEAARRVVAFAGERQQAGADGVPWQVDGPGGGHRCHHVFDLETDHATARERHIVQVHLVEGFTLLGDQVAVVDVDHAAALGAVHGHHRMLAVGGKEGDVAAAVVGHADHHRVGGVEHRHAALQHILHDHPLEDGQVFQGGDVVQAQMVARADVGHHRHLAAVEGQAFAQQAAARRFEHGGVDVGVHQHIAGASRAAAVAAVDGAPFDIDAVGIRHAGAQPGGGGQVGDQAHGGGFAIGAGDGDDGNAAVVAIGEHGADDGFAHRAALAERWGQVHAQARRGIDFHHAAALLLDGFQHAVAHQVDAADVQPHHVGGGDGARRHFRMDVVGNVGGGAAGRQIGVVAQDDAFAARRDRVGLIALRGQAGQGDVVEADLGQRGGVAVAAARVEVDLVDQLAHGGDAVADHLRRIAAGGGDQFVAHHQQAEIVTGQVALDHDVVAEFAGGDKSGRHLLLGGDVDGDALALVAVLRLDHHRQADFQRRRPGVVGVQRHAAVRHRHPGRVEQLLGQLLVLRDRFGDGAGAVDFGRLDFSLLAAPAEGDQAAVGQTAERDVAGDRRVDDGAGRRAQPHVLVEFAQLVQRGVDIEGGVVQRGLEQLLGQLESQFADHFFRILDHHLEHAGVRRGGGAAESDRAAGLCLQVQRRQFEHVGHRNAVVVAGRLQGRQGREARPQSRLEAGQIGDAFFIGRADHHRLDRGVVTPEVGASQRPYACYLHKP